MLRVLLECKKVRSEKIASILDKLANGFSIWIHRKLVYALFDLESFFELKELSKRLKRVNGLRFKYIKIKTVLKMSASEDDRKKGVGSVLPNGKNS